ncbi:MAG: hypothetical protein US86_C0002G0121 [Candidatus Daviesbacteria bacterium GW2011_GWA2_38_24]|uniref:YdbS-like PH domain-containing protein n=1 Tax=Candidatus Daviesbacteria bacterium GW2011_GWA2_38_24 TaxID=1618422 RepID=A0A0G0M009_9BACT|nr:MAG: hypothetical protein US86_C0002G0121 [Candidatus Daviesbacteria bacterium GW2011_GWA2_38_24]KKQ80765.1 MAG: hypothetical protein UT01_C0006G0026 [Candidatus Daviesbacteria bacterium GW2011_GWA1_38_7]OGE22749.1 MAG: hypothetical protein A2688_01400 [Candidatus Daviesbacteria bacterium RIFCSPHIGHO2_01_FULL_38_8]
MAKQYYKEQASLKEKQSFAKYLAEDEELIIATSFSSTYLRQRFIIQLVLPGAVFVLLGLGLSYFYKFDLLWGLLLGLMLSILFSLIKTWVTYQANRYLLTTRRVIVKRGFFTVKLASALYDKITHIEVDQSFVDRMFLHHGTILVHTAGSNSDEIVLQYVESPIEFKNILERLINREREQYGRQMSPVVALEGEVVD